MRGQYGSEGYLRPAPLLAAPENSDRRAVADASLGTANLICLALKSLELDQLVEERERDHTFFAVEEPEAHLHSHVQPPRTPSSINRRKPRRRESIRVGATPNETSVAQG